MNAISPHALRPAVGPDDRIVPTPRERQFMELLMDMTPEGASAFCDAIIAWHAGSEWIEHIQRSGRANGRTEAEVDAIIAQHQEAFA